MRPLLGRWLGLLLTLVLAGASLPPGAGADGAGLVIGVISNRPPSEMGPFWTPMATYLQRSLGREVAVRPMTHHELDQAIRERRVDLALLNPSHFVQLRESLGLSGAIATLVEEYGGVKVIALGGVIITRADRGDIATLRDLRGKRVAVIDTRSLEAYQAPLLELRRAGVRVPDGLTILQTDLPQDRVVEAVVSGAADAGFVRSGLIERLVQEKRLEAGRLKILNRHELPGFPYLLSTSLYPQRAMAVLPHVKGEEARHAASRLLGMPALHGDSQTRYWFTVPASYEGAEELLRELRLSPYEAAPAFFLDDVWRQYRWPLALILLSGGLVVALSLWFNRRLARNVAELRTAQAALATSEAQLRTVVEQARVGVALTDTGSGQSTIANPRLAEIVGCRIEDLPRLDWRQITHPDDLPAELAQMARMQAGETSGYQVEKRIRRPDGSTAWINLIVAAIAGQGGEPPRHLAMVEDITERKEAGDRLRAIADSAQDAILMMDPAGAITFWNPTAERVLGYRAEEAIGKNLHTLLAPERFLPAHRAAFPEFVRTGRGAAVNKILEVMGRHKDGREIPFALSLSAVSLRGAWHAVGILHDISDRKRYEAELLAAKQAAEAANAAKSTFLAHMSHEIRTPMNAVLGLTQILEREPLSDDQRAMVGRIGAAGRSLLGILNDILDLSRIEAGQLALETRPFELAPLLDHVRGVYAPLAQEKGLVFRRDGSPGLPEQLVGDAGRLEQILVNLVANALKFTERGEIRLRVQALAETAAAVRLRFEVQDTGIGIAPAALKTLFAPFVQADQTITRRYGGTGLGLAISKRLVEVMGGAIGATSAEGTGSTFRVDLPFARPAAASPTSDAGSATDRRSAEELPA